MFSLVLLPAFGMAEFFGFGENTDYYYLCSTPSFFVTDDENGRTGERYYTLRGVLATPQPGFMATFQFLSPGPPEASALLNVGQPVNPAFGRGLPSITQLKIEQSFQLPERTGLLRIRVAGLSAQPYEFTCDLTKTVMQDPALSHDHDD